MRITPLMQILAFAYQGKDIVFGFIIEYIVAYRGFWPLGSKSIFI
jgi:hypothetical protein